MTEKQREQLKDIEKRFSFLSFGVITHKQKGAPPNKHNKNLHLDDCYKSPSCAKRKAEKDIWRLMDEINGVSDLYAHDYTILSYNIMMFTCAFIVTDYQTGELIAMYYFTHTKSFCYEF